jgi:putative membrane protein
MAFKHLRVADRLWETILQVQLKNPPKEKRNMKPLVLKMTILAMLLTLPLLPAAAHHGNQFISRALEANAAEVQLANLAMSKAENPRVREFASTLKTDHTKAFNQLKTLENARMTNSGKTSPNQDAAGQSPDKMRLGRENQRTRDELVKLSAAAFDKRFMDVMVRQHRDAIRMFEEHSRAHGFNTQSGSATGRQKPSSRDSAADIAMDRDTAAFASEMLPGLRKHLQTAESIQRELNSGQTN